MRASPPPPPRLVLIACALVLGAGLLAAVPAAAQTPTPTPGGDCCSEHAGRGCNVGACQTCVCDIDDFCCSVAWDQTCVERAQSGDECAGDCPCPTATPTLTPTPGGDCCSGHDGPDCDVETCSACVCDIDPFCCDEFWDADCASLARTEGDCRDACPCKGDCCEPQSGPGCGDDPCQECVCSQEEFCCSEEGGVWDAECVERARDEPCAEVCGCLGDCCDPKETPGCDQDACEACVCDEEEFCCSEGGAWDQACVERAADPDGCGPICGCSPFLASCCFAHPGPGCLDSLCEACVCAEEEFCCSADGGVWDNNCVARALESCADFCVCGPTPATDCCVEHLIPGCAVETCQTCVCDLDENCCGETWDLTCVDEAANAVECTGLCMCEPRAVDDCCVAQTEPGCSDATCQECVCGADPVCCESVWDRNCASIAGDECRASCPCRRPCIGDCLGLGRVSVADLVAGINVILQYLPLASCPAFDYNGDGVITIDELVAGVDAALNGCR